MSKEKRRRFKSYVSQQPRSVGIHGTGGPVLEFAIYWIVAAFIWFGYFRQRPD